MLGARIPDEYAGATEADPAQQLYYACWKQKVLTEQEKQWLTVAVQDMLQAGADPDRTDNSGRSARDYALLDGEHSQMVKTIETYTQDGVGKDSKPVYGPTF